MVIDALLLLCGIFYAVLCVFSIVTGLMYASGKKKLNPLELSEKFMSRYTDSDKLKRFTIKMGWVIVPTLPVLNCHAILPSCSMIATVLTATALEAVAGLIALRAAWRLPRVCGTCRAFRVRLSTGYP